MHGFKSANFQFFQKGTFEPVHEIRKFFWPKVFFWSIMKMLIRKNIHNTSQGPPNPGFIQAVWGNDKNEKFSNFSCMLLNPNNFFQFEF